MSTWIGKSQPELYLVDETNHGIDGWDAKTTKVAAFTTEKKALDWLARKGFTFYQWGSYWHSDPNRRNTMGAISYHIQPSYRALPIDPED